MSKKKKKQENFFDLHDNYESIEDLEMELSKIIDAVNGLVEVLCDSNLPYNIKYGLVFGSIGGYFDNRADCIRRVSNIDALLAEILGGDDE